MIRINLKHKSAFNKTLICESDGIDISKYKFLLDKGKIKVLKSEEEISSTNGTNTLNLKELCFAPNGFKTSLIDKDKNIDITWSDVNDKGKRWKESWQNISFLDSNYLVKDHHAYGFNFSTNVTIEIKTVSNEDELDNAISILSYFWLSSEFHRTFYA